MQFQDIIGQNSIKQKLIHTVENGRISHAQMFTGPEGCGTLAMAMAYAQFICCLDKKENDSCGVCSSCKKIEKLIHPDLHFIFPVNTTKNITKDPISDNYLDEWRNYFLNHKYITPEGWYDYIGLENKQGLISVKDSNQILSKLALKSFESEYVIVIIWLPEKMNQSAANKLLKIIEEPSENTIFLLVANSIDLILPTILSRTQLLKFKRIDDGDLKKKIAVEFNITNESQLDYFIHLANGNYIKVVELINSSEEQENLLERFIEYMRIVYADNIQKLVDWINDIHSLGREKQKIFLLNSIRLIRENFILNFRQPELEYISAKEKEFSKKFHPFINKSNIHNIYNEFNKAYRDIEANGNAKIIFMDLAIKLNKLIRG